MTGFEALQRMDADPNALCRFNGGEYRVASGVLFVRTVRLLPSSVAPWKKSRLAPLVFLKDGWEEVGKP